jgi:hypothetical protein
VFDLQAAAAQVDRHDANLSLGQVQGLSDSGHPAAQFSVGLMFVAQTAHQTPAGTRDLAGIQRQVLFLGHLDGNRVEFARPRRATALPPAKPQPSGQGRAVSGTHLAQLDPLVQGGGKVSDQDPKVYSGFCAEVEQYPMTVQRGLGLQHLHGQSVMADPLAGKGQGLGSLEAAAVVLLEVLLLGSALHLGQVLGGFGVWGLHYQDDLTQFQAQWRGDEHPVSRFQVQFARVEVVEAARRAERDSDLRRHDGLSWTFR